MESVECDPHVTNVAHSICAPRLLDRMTWMSSNCLHFVCKGGWGGGGCGSQHVVIWSIGVCYDAVYSNIYPIIASFCVKR